MNRFKAASRRAAMLGALMGLAGCGSGIVSQTGPTVGAINNAPDRAKLAGIQVVNLDRKVTEALMARYKPADLVTDVGNAAPVGTVINPGDVIEIAIWEAPPAVLFSPGSTGASKTGEALSVSSTATLPDLLVGLDGVVSVPFAGPIQVAGRTPREIEADIVRRLSAKAHLPQVLVRLVRNASATVTVVGEVANSTRLPLTPKGERLLDALAAAGGSRQPSSRTTIQVTRGSKVVAVPLDQVIRDPRQNIVLATGDVLTAIFQPFSFTALGAAGRSQEVQFEATGLTLAQALGRINGLQEQRASAKGVFVFRWEKPAPDAAAAPSVTDVQGRVPVIYRVNLLEPSTFFLAQNFQMRDGDVLYVAAAPIAEFQQFVNVIASTVLPLAVVRTSLQ